MSFLQPLMLIALPLIALPVIIHLINQWRYQTKRWGAMMFLLAANRMNRGFARVRQWLILAMRTLAVAGLIFAIARPLASGVLGLSSGSRPDTTMVLVDRSPSMQQAGVNGTSKLLAGNQKVTSALETLGSAHWVSIDSADAAVRSYETIAQLSQSSALTATDATADIPAMLESALDYISSNSPGPTEIWISSDLQAADWKPDSGNWTLLRDQFARLPQSVRIHLVAYAESSDGEAAIRVTEARRVDENGSSALLLSFRITQQSMSGDGESSMPVEISIDGRTTVLNVELNGKQTEVRNHRIELPTGSIRGWGSVTIPSDENDANNRFYFVFDKPIQRRVVMVTDDRAATRPLQIAASIGIDGEVNNALEVLAPQQLDSLVLDGAALLVWQGDLPDKSFAATIDNYVAAGGQVMFFPPTRIGARQQAEEFHGIAWSEWIETEQPVAVENWRGDQDLLAVTESGSGLPVGQLSVSRHAGLKASEQPTVLASLSGGDPLLVRVPTAKGGIYFCSASTTSRDSTLAENGVVLFVALQRAIERGQEALGNSIARVAGEVTDAPDNWVRIAGNGEILSTEYPLHSGIYECEGQLFAVNRAMEEDQRDVVSDERLSELFEGLNFSRIDDQADNLSGLVREIWRVFLIAMILALLLEAALCLPKVARSKAAQQLDQLDGFGRKRDSQFGSKTTSPAA